MFRFLFDENMHGSLVGLVLTACRRTGVKPLDIVRVGKAGAPDYGTPDPELVVWTMNEQRLLVTYDHSTIPGFLADHLATGLPHPGVLLVRRRLPLAAVAESLLLIASASLPGDYADRCEWIPFS